MTQVTGVFSYVNAPKTKYVKPFMSNQRIVIGFETCVRVV